MRARKCDRCGKLYEHYDGIVMFKNAEKANAITLVDKGLDNNCLERKSYDLCPECMEKLESFIKHADENIKGIEEIKESIASAKSDVQSWVLGIMELCSRMNKTGAVPKWYVKATGQEYKGPVYLMGGVGHLDRFGNKVELRWE